jgi:hypothetical protein
MDATEAAEAWRAALPPSLHALVPSFVEEELTPTLFASMADLGAALAELGVSAAASAEVLQIFKGEPAVPPPPPAVAPSPAEPPSAAGDRPSVATAPALLRSPPRGWPSSAGDATPFISKELHGTRVRQVGELAASNSALLAGLSLRDDARSNAVRVRDRMSWAILGGFALMERADADEAAGGSARYVAVPHYWNVTPRGLWVDATPRPHAHLQLLVLVESTRMPPPPPPYEAQPTNPLVIVAVEGLCNRLRAVLSYRQVAHEQVRALRRAPRRLHATHRSRARAAQCGLAASVASHAPRRCDEPGSSPSGRAVRHRTLRRAGRSPSSGARMTSARAISPTASSLSLASSSSSRHPRASRSTACMLPETRTQASRKRALHLSSSP